MTQPTDIAIVILAAGQGTRMKSSHPKVLHPIASKPLIAYLLETVGKFSPRHCILVHSNELAPYKEKLQAWSPIPLSFCLQKEQLGTGHAVKTALSHLEGFKGHVIVVYADTPFLSETTLETMLYALETLDLCVAGFTPNNPGALGRLVVKYGNILERVVEYKDASDAERAITLCNSGIIAMDASLLHRYIEDIQPHNKQNEYYLVDLVEIFTQKDHRAGYIQAKEPEEFMGVNTREDLALLETHMQNKLRKQAMLAGATLVDPATVYFSHDTRLACDVTVHPHVVFGESVEIDVHTTIHSFSHLAGVRIAPHCTVGPFARIRPGSELKTYAAIGNFVELKQSTLEAHAKAGHLSYLGDAHIGEHTNIGAGTITCNYDGIHKHKTTIGEYVFVGSNTAFVAPVTIGDHALIAAGSTITKSVEPQSLAFGRAKQVVKPNYQKKTKSS